MWKLYFLRTKTHWSHLLSAHIDLLPAGCQVLCKRVRMHKGTAVCVKCPQANACPSEHGATSSKCPPGREVKEHALMWSIAQEWDLSELRAWGNVPLLHSPMSSVVFLSSQCGTAITPLPMSTFLCSSRALFCSLFSIYVVWMFGVYWHCVLFHGLARG